MFSLLCSFPQLERLSHHPQPLATNCLFTYLTPEPPGPTRPFSSTNPKVYLNNLSSSTFSLWVSLIGHKALSSWSSEMPSLESIFVLPLLYSPHLRSSWLYYFSAWNSVNCHPVPGSLSQNKFLSQAPQGFHNRSPTFSQPEASQHQTVLDSPGRRISGWDHSSLPKPFYESPSSLGSPFTLLDQNQTKLALPTYIQGRVFKDQGQTLLASGNPPNSSGSEVSFPPPLSFRAVISERNCPILSSLYFWLVMGPDCSTVTILNTYQLGPVSTRSIPLTSPSALLSWGSFWITDSICLYQRLLQTQIPDLP